MVYLMRANQLIRHNKITLLENINRCNFIETPNLHIITKNKHHNTISHQITSA
nr:MAG TPA: hypothetical protein [Caudoviricetes sp.]DAM09709.1 MAG TPA: hypothetical protein [Caudoviricetes sp.]